MSISEAEFEHICDGIYDDRETIIKYNPIGTPEEIILWMLMNCLVAYLSLTEMETPVLTGKPNVNTYRDAIIYILNDRKSGIFDEQPYLDRLVNP